MEATLFNVIFCCFLWTFLYFAFCFLNKSKSSEWNCRLVSVAHAFTSIALCTYSLLFVENSWPFKDAGRENTAMQILCITITLGYFIYDLLWCVYFQTEGLMMLFHHVCSIAGTSVTLYAGRTGTEMTATIWGSELTNPLLQLRWFLREVNQQDTWLAEINELIFMSAFFILRIGIGSYLLCIECIWSSLVPWWGCLGGSVIYGIGWLFMINIALYAKRKYQNKWTRVSGTFPAAPVTVVTPAVNQIVRQGGQLASDAS